MLSYHLTDTHFPNDNGALAAFVEAIASGRIERPELVLHSGDLVDGADSPEALRAQLRGARALLDRMGVPWRAICHSHDRMGEPLAEAGASFRDVIGQPFLQHVPVEGLDIFMVSGSITCDPAYQPTGGSAPPPWGYDFFDTHVIRAVEDFVDRRAHGTARMLLYHLPVGPMREADIDGGPLRKHLCGIGEEGTERILGLCQRARIRVILGGHLHINAHRVRHGIHLITTSSLLDAPRGYRRIEWDGRDLRLYWEALDWPDAAGRWTLPGSDPLDAHLFHAGTAAERDVVVRMV